MSSATVLIIEDDDTLRDVYAAKLSLEGFDVDTAVDGQEGLEKATQSEPNVILLDMLMPRLSGLQFLNAYQQPTRHPHVKTIVLSNKSTQQDVMQAKSMGALDYLIKSQNSPQDIVTRIRRLDRS